MASILSGVCHTCHIPLAKNAFTLQLAISSLHQRFTCVHLSKTYLPFLKGFSLSVHHQTLASPAAQGDLTTLPDIALPMGHYPSSVKNFMAQAKDRKGLWKIINKEMFNNQPTMFNALHFRTTLLNDHPSCPTKSF